MLTGMSDHDTATLDVVDTREWRAGTYRDEDGDVMCLYLAAINPDGTADTLLVAPLVNDEMRATLAQIVDEHTRATA